jgi:hypothetical protein
MSDRFRKQTTGHGRLAVIVIEHRAAIREQNRLAGRIGPDDIDVRDTAQALRPYFLRELVLDRIDQARKQAGRSLTERMEELAKELADVEKEIPPEDRL